jgi:hypothetical protein
MVDDGATVAADFEAYPDAAEHLIDSAGWRSRVRCCGSRSRDLGDRRMIQTGVATVAAR